MNSESRQLRGWKEIAGHLRVSERSAKRWEQSRGLPVRRMAGSSRDVVFAFTEELDSWLRNHEAAADEEASTEQTAPMVASADGSGAGSPSAASARDRLQNGGVLIIAVVLVAAVVAAFWLSRTTAVGRDTNARQSASPATVKREPIVPTAEGVSRRLKISFPGGSPFELELVDGVCGGLELEPPQWLELCTRPRGDRLLLEARILPTGASVEARAAQRSFNVVLEHDSRARIETPIPLDVEWLTSVREAPANAPPDRR